MKKANLMLHPVRLRILTQVIGKQMTTAMLASVLPDIPQATLYRQIKTLVEGGILEIVAEREAHGATERTYAVAKGGDRLGDGDFNQVSADDHLRYFTIFTSTLIDTFATYLQQANLSQLQSDGLSYNSVALYLSNGEREELRKMLFTAIQQVISNPPTSERRRYTLASVVIPGNSI